MDRRQKLLVSPYEEQTYRALTEAGNHARFKVNMKTGVKDALAIDRSGLTDEEYRYALRAHFDFVVIRDESTCVFAVEFDGSQHKIDPVTQARDRLKDSICEKLGMPLLRIDAGFLRRLGRFSVVGWLAELWFLNDAFCQAQLAGCVPQDGVFDYGSVVGFAYRRGEEIIQIDASDQEGMRHLGEGFVNFPYDPSYEARRYIDRRAKEGKTLDWVATEMWAKETDGYYVACALVRTSDGTIVGRSRCKAFRFPPVAPSELACELAVLDAAKRLRAHLAGRSYAVGPDEIDRIRDEQNWLVSFSGDPQFSQSLYWGRGEAVQNV